MKKRVASSLPIAMMSVCAMLIVSCTSSDINDVYEGPKVEADENPLGNLTPSASFMWSTMEHSHLTIEVDDHFDNQYDYYVNLYAENPCATNKPNALFSGVARGNKPAKFELDLPGSASNIYVEVKDPQGHVMTYGYAAPKAGANVTLPCVMGEPAQGNVKSIVIPDEPTGTETKTVSSPYFEMPQAAAAPTMDWSVPADAVELTPQHSYKNSTYVVSAGQTVTLANASQLKGRIVVEGTLDMTGSDLTLSNAQLYVKNGGRVMANKINMYYYSILAIDKGAELQLNNLHSSATGYFYTAGKAYIATDILFYNQSKIYVAPTGQIIGAVKDSQAIEDQAYTLTVSTFADQIFIDADDENSGQFLCGNVNNNNSYGRLVVADNAHMYIAEKLNFQCPVYNAGLFEVNMIDGSNVWYAQIYNTCTMIVKHSIKQVQKVTVKHGTISGGVSTNEDGSLVFSPVPQFSFPNNYDTHIYLLDGAYMDIQDWNVARAYIQAYDESRSYGSSLWRVRGQLKTAKWYATNLYGDMVMEYNPKQYKGYVVPYTGVAIADLFETVIDLETCTGNIPGRDEDDDEEIVQTNPYVGSVQSGYTVNFEDQWPVIGDYDVNDIVLHMDKIETLQTATKVKEATFTVHLLAVGASYTLGAGLQLDNITNDEIASVEYSTKGQAGMMDKDAGAFKLAGNGAEKGSGSSKAVLPLFYDAHKLYLHNATASEADHHPLNTGSTHTAGAGFTIKVTFADDATVAPEDLMVSALNFFIFRPEDEAAVDGKRVEVHLKGYAPTRLATDVYNGKGNDSSTRNSYYVSKDGFPWGIIVNDINGGETSRPWNWPSERKLITNEYGSFAQWVNSNGTDATDWMMQEID